MKRYLLILATTFSLLITTQNAIASDDHKVKILVLGDSLSAGYGIEKEKGWVNLLRIKLQEQAVIINASISGETSDGGLAALPQHLNNYSPEIVILELGANDGLRGFPLQVIRSNLEELITTVEKSGALAVLIGIHIPPNYGPRYAQGFHSIFIELAEQKNLPLVPFLLDKIALDPSLMQEDQLHPTAEAQPIILENVLPTILKALDRVNSSN